MPWSNPQTAFFHVFFKAAALFVYIFCGLFNSDDFVINFVVCVLLLACDFWVVKNVSGRILVGLRWWNEIDEAGKSEWKFESLTPAEMENLQPEESRLFWWSMYFQSAAWVLMSLSAIIGFKLGYLMVVLVALTLNGSNLYGYYQCSADHKKQIASWSDSLTGSMNLLNMSNKMSSAFSAI
mmetsp:Transcript_42312/g.51333  ORF Transcript_42312/g.51333 Transcript_42312/m.51333 type:complete len:181 (+) Transcript_42312:199-741(+)|eukprot:CAMPEP_0197854984 /NCGR_PEP_ID=MMETSP1438-20131217/25722_1 /TAXON_ID=1461541 /ORGANISM="Pterosperma sp., Strain CCMP1384" /LENGTH=180 /DNA_ID=CAMNT_0043469933 /DNA_START=198 /DNA_END=740 /DNA_ORIENTATION=+